MLGRPDFQRLSALRTHREALEEQLARTRRLLETIDHTIDHLEGRTPMTDEQMFAGFTVAAGDDRFGECVRLGGEPNDCKLAAGRCSCRYDVDRDDAEVITAMTALADGSLGEEALAQWSRDAMVPLSPQ